MYVRDHTRPELKQAMGLEPGEYDFEVFRITNEITKQVFPIMLDIDHPEFRAGLEQLFACTQKANAGRVAGGMVGRVRQAYWATAGVLTFVKMYFLPVKSNALPNEVRMVPAW
jgi:magnesium-protoporphyrin IX monomethyl ester (oxidative) cyclase